MTLKNIQISIFHLLQIDNLRDDDDDDLYELVQTEQVGSLYNIFKNIMKDSSMESFIMNHVSNTKKIHFYFLYEDKERYVKNNKYLPIIYPEHQDLAL